MSVIEQLANQLKKGSVFDFEISNSQFKSQQKIRFFKNAGNGSKWNLDLSLDLINDAIVNAEIDVDKLYAGLARALLRNFQIGRNGTAPKTNIQQIEKKYDLTNLHSDTVTLYNKCNDSLSTIRKDVVIITENSKTGKTTMMKNYCNKLLKGGNFGKLWWLDFNNGASDFSEFIAELCKNNLEKNNYIVLDNIDCCGTIEATNILDFWISMAREIKAQVKGLQVFVLSDCDMDISVSDYDNVEVCKNFLTKLETSDDKKNEFNQHAYTQILENVRKFLKDLSIQDNIKKEIIKMIFFGQYDIKLECETDDLWNQLQQLSGLKRNADKQVAGIPASFCKSLVNDLAEEFKQVIGENELTQYTDNIFACYGTLKHRTIWGFYNIVKELRDKVEHNELIIQYDSILKTAENAILSVAKYINSGDSQKPLDGHLGAILFASEALSSYVSLNPSVLTAWKKLNDFVKKVYYIYGQDGHSLPTIHNDYQSFDGLHIDFVASKLDKSLNNCLETQIKIHDELLALSSTPNGLDDSVDINCLVNAELTELDDNQFTLCISRFQKDAQENFDIEKFFATYVLTLLFEYEVTAPDSLRDISRIEKLWDMMKDNFQVKDNYAYLYPKRVPWVTARALLAMSRHKDIPKASQRIEREINNYIDQLTQYLINCSMTFTRNGEKYRFWSAGTGFWNSALETSMMCAFAIKTVAYNTYSDVYEQSKKFIELFECKWSQGNTIADGIWAYQTTKLNDLCENNLLEKINEINKRFIKNEESLTFPTNPNKNDRSLGFWHIASTFVDLVKKVVEVNPVIRYKHSCKENSNDSEIGDNISKVSNSNVQKSNEERKLSENITRLIEKLEDYIASHQGKEHSTEIGIVNDYISQLKSLQTNKEKKNAKEIGKQYGMIFSSATDQNLV